MATLKDIARRVGVSVTTVSRVINGKGAISPETRQRVFQVMQELDYHPNELARSLVGGSSHILGLVVPYIDHAYFGALTAGVEEAASRAGYKLFLCSSGGDPQRERQQLAALVGGGAAGVLLCSRSLQDAGSLPDAGGVPLVTIEQSLPGVPSVSCDNYQGGLLAARELLESGCQAPLLFGNRIVSQSLPAMGRYQGFMDGCRQGGRPCQAYYIHQEDLFGRSLEQDLRLARQRFPQTDGLFVTGDVLAASVQTALWRLWPQWAATLSLVGFDGVSVSEYCRLSTVAQPLREMGRAAVEALVGCIRGEQVPLETVLPVRLIRRESSGPKAT